LRFHTSTAKTAQEIHDMGLAEVARIEGRFQKEVLDVLNFKGTFTEFADSLKNDSSFFYEAKEELLEGYRQLKNSLLASLPQM